MNVQEYADHIVDILKTTMRDGIDPGYDDVADWQWDFWPSMPWTPEKSEQVGRAILDNPNRMIVVDTFDILHGLEGNDRIRVGIEGYANNEYTNTVKDAQMLYAMGDS